MADNIELPGTSPPIYIESEDMGGGVERVVQQTLAPGGDTLTDCGGVLESGSGSIGAVASKYRYVQNQDITPLTLQFGADGPTWALRAADQVGGEGGDWDTTRFLFSGEILLSSDTPGAKFGAGYL